MDLDGFFFERIGLFFDGQLVLFQFHGVQPFGTLGCHQGYAEMGVHFRQVKCRCCGRFSELIINKPVKRFGDLLHQFALLLQIQVKRFYQPDGNKPFKCHLAKHQRRISRKITGPVSTQAARGGVDGDNLSEFLVIGIEIVLRLKNVSDFIACLQINIHRFRKIVYIATINCKRADGIVVLAI